MIRAYIRVSTVRQNLQVQLNKLGDYKDDEGNGVDIIYQEKQSAVKDRPELERMKKDLKKGDTVVVYKLDRIGRSTIDLLQILKHFTRREIKFVSLKESIDTSTHTGMLIVTVLAAIAEFERGVINDRTMEGKIASWERGVKKGKGFKHINRYVHCKGLEEDCLKPYKLNGRMVTMSRRTFYYYKKLATNFRLMTKTEFCKEYGLNTAQYKKNFKKLKKIPPLNLEQRYVTFTRSQRLVANRDTAEERV
jgi:DNA invertase Pin-like site-specific DNA recombinase